ncbi:MAG: o-succinylbenzoate synthase [Candidatus Omnitrophica bacterium]|nr:o-succinylbenzoate synthase [Candidatus Omnitrophota bacterium]
MDNIIIEKILLYDVSFPLKKPYSLRNELIRSRDIIVVQVVTEQGTLGFGEAAPLPGLSPEPLKKVRHQLELLAEDWKGRALPARGTDLLTYLEKALDSALFCHSVKFALESAVLMASARVEGLIPCQLITGKGPRAVQSAGLLQGSLPEVLEQARLQKTQGVSVFNLKLGNRNVPLDIRKVEEVKALLGPTGVLRLDANRSWRFDEALLFAQNIGKNQIEYFEEPCAQNDKWETLYRLTDIPLAADESLALHNIEDLSGMHGLSCFVVKPTVWGGVTGCLSMLRLAKAAAKKVVISSAFESGIGLTMLANLAVLSGEVADFGSFNWLAGDTLQEPLMTPSGIIPVPRLNLAPEDLGAGLRGQLVTC